MTYEELEAEINAVPKFGTGAGLSNLSEYLKLMNRPEESLRVIHVAGTNGKGSVCAFLESILRHAGYNTGLFTSPHLIKINERFRINFEPVSDKRMIQAWKAVRLLLERGKKKNLKPVSWFEIMFLMALWIFAESDIDYCIMETGLGGRLDATALLKPMISVITSISLDHMPVLGDTVEQIAFEKAGIIKEGVPAVAIDENNGAFPVLLTESKRKNVHIEKVSCDDVTILKKRKNKIDFSINTSYYRDEPLTISGRADYQVYNAALAITALKMILPELEKEIIQKGLLHMRWEGRMEEICPGVFLDGAHNPGAIAQICNSLKEDEAQWVLLFAVCGDKDYTDMIRMLSGISWGRIYLTQMEGSRRASVTEMEDCFRRYTDTALISKDDAKEAFLTAFRDKNEKEQLLCLGSLYLVGEIKSMINRLKIR